MRTTLHILAAAVMLALSAPRADASFQLTMKGDKLVYQQTAASGDVRLTNEDALGNLLLIEGANPVSLVQPLPNVSIKLLEGSGTALEVDLSKPLLGSLTIDLGDGDRTLALTGSSNVIGKKLTILGGTGAQQVTLTATAPLFVRGDLRVRLGSGHDAVTTGAEGVTALGDFELDGVDDFACDALLTVGGDLLFETENDVATPGTTIVNNNDRIFIVGDFVVRNADDKSISLDLDGPIVIDDDLDVDLGAGVADHSLFAFSQFRIGGDFSVHSSGPSPDNVRCGSLPSASVAGDIDVDLGDGENQFELSAFALSKHIRYDGGSQSDVVTLNVNTVDAECVVNLKGDSDTFTFLPFNALKKLIVNFGGGTDTFSDFFGPPYPFEVKLKNLP